MKRGLIVDSLWCMALSIFVLMGIRLVPLHGDEPTLIFMGRDFYYHLQGNTSQIGFQDWEALTGEAATEQQLRLINGTLPKYLYGAIAYFSGYAIDDINQQWAWGLGWDWNFDNGHVPPDALLYRTRLVSTGLLAVSALALFGIGHIIAGRAVAMIASAYYVLNPAILMNGRRAMMEGSMLAFTLLALLIALQLLKHRSWWWYIILGIVSGLAVASKHTAIVTIAAIFISCSIYLLLKEKDRFQPILRLIGAGVVSLIVFFVLNPAWWSDPLGAMRATLDLRGDLLSSQVGFFGGYGSRLEQVQGFANQSFIVIPMYAESDLDGFISNQTDIIAQYQASPFSGISIGGSWLGGLLLAVLTIIGAINLWLSSHIESSTKWIMMAWLIAMVALTLGLTPLEWQRYYIPIYPVIGLLSALGIVYSVTIVKNSNITSTQAHES